MCLRGRHASARGGHGHGATPARGSEVLALAQLLEKARSQEAEAAQLPFALQRAPL
ncbi:hypothetical protein [Azohydromonas lata]|uniref:Uncharacterized protein n=1 Tax=Azohydromonas lata TaxID=45677 RepID=A0ABU5I7H8_9BURK|nr:hypothetical protein [Azohydromonas lata]MDZ5455039.1 hypothetical protein [Azohydromonas lata]